MSKPIAVVTGAGKGIGRAIALRLAEDGFLVHAIARTETDLADLAAQHGAIVPHVADVLDPDFPSHVAALPLHVLVNNVGTNQPMPIADTPVDVLDRMLTLNVRSVYLASQAAVRAMQRHGRGGSIVMITSQMGHVGSPRRTVYCMTKHALEGLTKAMAVELAPENIRVNSVAPTFIETPMTAPMLADPAFRQFVLDSIPMGQIGLPEDVAAAVSYLCSPGARLVTGTSLRVDGGWTAR